MTSAPKAARAIRQATAFLEPTHVALCEVRGSGAFDTLDRLLPCDLFVYDGQARRTVLLDDDGSVLADVLVAKIDGAYLLFVDGLRYEDVSRLAREAAPEPSAIELRDVSETNALISLHGPFAWELCASWLGQGLVSLPPLALYRTPLGVVVRAGRTGEYGYEVLLPAASFASARARLLELGAAFDLERAPLELIDQCALENGGYVQRHAEGAGLSPIELQLQWRTSSKKSYRGSAGLERRRAAATERVAWFTAASIIAPGTPVLEDGTPCGKVLVCFAAWQRTGSAVGQALLDRRLSHPGLDFMAGSSLTLHTASPPLVEPTSHRVRVQIDRYATRDRSRFPDSWET